MPPHHNDTAGTTRELLRDASKSHYTYRGQPVTLVTVLAGRGRRIAIVENEAGEQFDVPADALR